MKFRALPLFLLFVLSSAHLISLSPTTRTARTATQKLQLATEQTNDVDELVGDTNLYNLFLNGFAISFQLVDIICTVTSLLLTLANTDDSFSTIDSEEVFRHTLTFISSQSALMDRLSGRYGLLASFCLSESVRSSIIVLETAVEQLAKNTVRLVPMREEELAESFECIGGDYKKLLKNYSGYKRVGEL